MKKVQQRCLKCNKLFGGKIDVQILRKYKMSGMCYDCTFNPKVK